MDYLPLIAPLFGVFLLQTCVFGCMFARTNQRSRELEQRITELNNEFYRLATRQQRTPPFQSIAPPPAALPLPPPPPLMLAPRPMYYYTAPPLPSAPPRLSVVDNDPQSPLRV